MKSVEGVSKLRSLVLTCGVLAITSGPVSALMVTRSGSTLLINGSPARLIAYNNYGMVAETAFDYEAFLDTIRDNYGINFVRVWCNFHWCNDLTPFSGTRPNYNLLVKNTAFYNRLEAFVAYADAKGIVVQVCLFDAVALADTGNRWPYFPYNTAMNVQSYINSGTPMAFDDVPSAWWTNVSVPLIDEVVDRLGDFGNVIYEAINEPDSHGVDVGSTTFDAAVVDRLYQQLQSPQYSGSKIISVNPEGAGGTLWNWALNSNKVDLLAKHTHDPGQGDDHNGLSKPIIISNDGDISQQTGSDYPGNFGGLVQAERIARINTYLNNTFNTGAAPGHNHFECLDKGMHGTSWLSNPPDYNPRVSQINTGILSALSAYTISSPGKATNPTPAHSTPGVSVTTNVSWTGGSGATSHNVYFGTTSPGVSQGNQASTTYSPAGTLLPNTVYYWRIDSVNSNGTTLGDVWSFTTTGAPGDHDDDGDVDLDDFARFQQCLSGSGNEQTDPNCFWADFDDDGDVDGQDLETFQGCVSGAGLSADVSCAS